MCVSLSNAHRAAAGPFRVWRAAGLLQPPSVTTAPIAARPPLTKSLLLIEAPKTVAITCRLSDYSLSQRPEVVCRSAKPTTLSDLTLWTLSLRGGQRAWPQGPDVAIPQSQYL